MADILNILVIDDDHLVRMAIVRTLKGFFPTFLVADFASGTAALIEAEKRAFDLAILDLHMPEMGGVEVARKLRIVRGDLPLLFVTGDIESKEAAAARTLAPVAVLRKPWSSSEVRSLVAAVLEDRRKR